MLLFALSFLMCIPLVIVSFVGLVVIYDPVEDFIDDHIVAIRRILYSIAICIVAIVASSRLINEFKSQPNDGPMPIVRELSSGHKTGKAIVLSPGEAAEHKENLLRRINPDDEEYNVDILAYTANTFNGDKEYTATYLLEHPERARALYETIEPMIQGSSVTIQSFQN